MNRTIKRDDSHAVLLYGGIALGVLAGAALSTYIWRQRVQAGLEHTPLERADQLIEACESKLDRIEKLMSDLEEKNR